MSLTLYFLRHGETESSLNDVFCGNLDPDLTPQGKLNRELREKKI
ncbi:histidine phosphatase family protein [Crocosphaera sp.]